MSEGTQHLWFVEFLDVWPLFIWSLSPSCVLWAIVSTRAINKSHACPPPYVERGGQARSVVDLNWSVISLCTQQMSKTTTAQYCLFKYSVYLDGYLLAGLGLCSLCKDSSFLIWVIFGMESTRGTAADFFSRRRKISHYRWSCWNATEEGRWKRAFEHEALRAFRKQMCNWNLCA